MMMMMLQFHSAMCCEFMTAVYWSVSGWLLIGFSLCLCGCPALVLGYKRFPSQLWVRPALLPLLLLLLLLLCSTPNS